MANNYRQFSCALAIEPGEVEWCRNKLAELRRTPNDGPYKPIAEDEEIEQYESCADFSYAVSLKDCEVWMYSEESGSTNHVAEFVQMYLAKFHPRQCWSMSWADTCDKPRVGEFSGGAVFVTADEIEYCEAQNWARSRADEFIRNLPGVRCDGAHGGICDAPNCYHSVEVSS